MHEIPELDKKGLRQFGLIFGAITLAARGSIWPAAVAHGSSNSIGIMELYLGS